MRIGLGIPQIGRFATPASVRTVAVAAEAAGFDSLWALDRLLTPLVPRTPYPGTADGILPEPHKVVLDPLGVLTMAATVTDHVRIGTAVLVAPWYPPVLMARSLTTLDHLSGGRLDVGLGGGWSADELAAVGAESGDVGRRTEEVLDVLEAIWCGEPVSVTTTHERIAPSFIRPKPRQSPRPPVLLAAAPAELDRVARRADGWLAELLPFDALEEQWATLRTLTAAHGRDPDAVRLVVRADVVRTAADLAGDRPAFHGSAAQLRADVERTAGLGAHELILDLQATTRSPDELLELACTLATPALAGLAR